VGLEDDLDLVATGEVVLLELGSLVTLGAADTAGLVDFFAVDDADAFVRHRILLFEWLESSSHSAFQVKQCPPTCGITMLLSPSRNSSESLLNLTGGQFTNHLPGVNLTNHPVFLDFDLVWALLFP
jgi:hypothetical protein